MVLLIESGANAYPFSKTGGKEGRTLKGSSITSESPYDMAVRLYGEGGGKFGEYLSAKNVK